MARYWPIVDALIWRCGSATPAVVEMDLALDGGGTGEVAFEWQKGGGKDIWDISVRTAGEAGTIETLMLRGVRTLLRDSAVLCSAEHDEEYAGVYRDFAHAVERGASKVSLREMRIIEDTAMIAEVERSETAF
jgi:hypothetical protein